MEAPTRDGPLVITNAPSFVRMLAGRTRQGKALGDASVPRSFRTDSGPVR
jgi:hypothetical protein